MHLNSSQQKAVQYQGGHLLIAAGPGTGKTHTITLKIIEAIKALPRSRKILAITFTNKAAQEMKDRLKKRLWNVESKAFIGTFHGFCLEILRNYANQSSLPDGFRIIEPEEAEALVKEIWPQRKSSQRKEALEQISRWKTIEFSSQPQADTVLYSQRLRKTGCLDFDDLILEALILLSGHPEILNEIQSMYQYIFVDEYQDINPAQHALLLQLSGKENIMTAIGDPQQTIYGFRGSDVRFFERFEKDFAGAVRINLSENYRSAPNLLAACAQVIAKAEGAVVPELIARIHMQGYLAIHESLTEKAEAEYVVHSIEKIIGGTSMFSQDSKRVDGGSECAHSFGDIAVLYRLNSQRTALREAFERSGIPYQIAGLKAQSDEPDEICPSRGIDVEVNAEKVSLMTIHAAKGLEFPVVFIAGCEEKILPLDLEMMRSDLEEERRLFYVGMTRAKERLYLSSAQHRQIYGKSYDQTPSRFLSDIEESLKIYEKSLSDFKKVKKESQQLTLFDL